MISSLRPLALALKAVPAANSAWIAEGEQGNKSDLIRTYHRADISVAVSDRWRADYADYP